MPNAAFFAFYADNCPLAGDIQAKEPEPSNQTEREAQALLESHPHFRGRRQWVRCVCVERRMYLEGCVPTYYLKQLAQEAIRELEGVDIVVNRIRVANSGLETRHPLRLSNELDLHHDGQ